jgi:hypothetical protein
MTYDEAKAHRDALDAACKAASRAFIVFPKGALGLTTDAAKATPEYRKARRTYELAAGALRDFNRLFIVRYKPEIGAERKSRCG